MKLRSSTLGICLFFLTGLAACNVPTAFAVTLPPEGFALTQTAQALVWTQAAALATPLAPTVSAQMTATDTEDRSIAKTAANLTAAVVQPSPTAALPCDRAKAGSLLDVTMPDDSPVLPRQLFSKTWRLVNVGSCTWTRSYAVVWFSGETFAGVRQQYLLRDVPPGESVDVTVDMVAPDMPGQHQSNWKLRNANGEFFGIGPHGDAPFWVRIQVQPDLASTQTPVLEGTPARVVLVSGLVGMQLDQQVDLDSGLLNQGAADDFVFTQNAEGVVDLKALGNAGLVVMIKPAPMLEDCQTVLPDQEKLLLTAQTEGVFLCYRTNEGRLGTAHIVLFNPAQSALNLRFITWAQP